MKNSKNRKFICKGINNALAILGSNRFEILNIDILKGGRGEDIFLYKNAKESKLTYKSKNSKIDWKRYNLKKM